MGFATHSEEPPNFFSARWNSYTNPDLAFAIFRRNDLKPEKRVLDRFPRSHHRPSIITVPSLAQPAAGKPVRRWNFRKANWRLFMAETERTAGLREPEAADVDAAYAAYCEVLLRQQSTTSRAATTRTTSRAGMRSAAACCANTSRRAPWKKWTQQQQHYCRSWKTLEGPGGQK